MGFIFSALGSIQQGEAAQNSANYNAEVARNNATHAVLAGQAQAMDVGLQSAATGGRIKASQAANGINVNSGSAVAVQKGQREAGEVNQANTVNNSLVTAYGYKAQAGLDVYQGKTAMIAGEIGAAGDIAGGIQQFAGLGGGSSTASPTGQALQSSALLGD